MSQKTSTKYYKMPIGENWQYFRLKVVERGSGAYCSIAKIEIKVVDYMDGNLRDPNVGSGPEELVSVFLGTSLEITKEEFREARVARMRD